MILIIIKHTSKLQHRYLILGQNFTLFMSPITRCTADRSYRYFQSLIVSLNHSSYPVT